MLGITQEMNKFKYNNTEENVHTHHSIWEKRLFIDEKVTITEKIF